LVSIKIRISFKKGENHKELYNALDYLDRFINSLSDGAVEITIEQEESQT